MCHPLVGKGIVTILRFTVGKFSFFVIPINRAIEQSMSKEERRVAKQVSHQFTR